MHRLPKRLPRWGGCCLPSPSPHAEGGGGWGWGGEGYPGSALPSDDFVSLSCDDPNRFQFATNEDIWEKADALTAASAAHMDRPAFARLQTSLGLHFEPESLLWDVELRQYVKPADVLTYDGMHILLANGLLDNELTLFLPQLLAAGFPWNAITAVFEADWKTCKVFRQGRPLRGIFTEYRRSKLAKEHVFSTFASEGFALVPILGYLLWTVAIPRLRALGVDLTAQMQSFFALQSVIALIKEGKRADGAHPREVLQAIRRHLVAFKRAYPDAVCKPKNHWLWHLALQLERDGFCMDCFVGERFNHLLKTSIRELDNTTDFEHSVTRRLLAYHLEALEHPEANSDTLSKAVRCEELEGISVAGRHVTVAHIGLAGRFDGCVLAEGDMVRLNDVIHQVLSRLSQTSPATRPGFQARPGPRGAVWLRRGNTGWKLGGRAPLLGRRARGARSLM